MITVSFDIIWRDIRPVNRLRIRMVVRAVTGTRTLVRAKRMKVRELEGEK